MDVFAIILIMGLITVYIDDFTEWMDNYFFGEDRKLEEEL